VVQTGTDPRILIVRLRYVPFMDITGLLTLQEVISKLKGRGVRFMLCEANHRVHAKLWKADVLKCLEENDYSDSFQVVLARACKSIIELDKTDADITL
jgi:SulP family sulfate permease